VKHIPAIVNGEIVTNNCKNSVPYTGSVHNRLNKIDNLNYNIMKNESNEVNNHNIMIVGDSHARGSAIRIGEYLGTEFEVYGIVKPGANIVDIVTQSSMNYMHLTKNDVIVFHGGSNDVYSNNAKAALLRIVKFCEVVNNTNIIVLDIPYRHDLEKNSNVNKEIQMFNRKLRKVTKHFNHVTILELSLNREAFTQHGLHLNSLGKRLIAKQIAMEIYGLIEEKVESLISLEWKSVAKGNLETIIPAPSGFDNLKEQQNNPTNGKQIFTVH
jgi:hypothetical protein